MKFTSVRIDRSIDHSAFIGATPIATNTNKSGVIYIYMVVIWQIHNTLHCFCCWLSINPPKKKMLHTIKKRGVVGLVESECESMNPSKYEFCRFHFFRYPISECHNGNTHDRLGLILIANIFGPAEQRSKLWNQWTGCCSGCSKRIQSAGYCRWTSHRSR